MKNILCISLLAFSFWVNGAEKADKDSAVVPGYSFEATTRDPFQKYVPPQPEAVDVADKELVEGEEPETKKASPVKILGAMKGSGDQKIGVFNLGVFIEGKSKSVLWGGKQVDVTLLSLDVVTMKAKIKIGKDIINVTKNGGTK